MKKFKKSTAIVLSVLIGIIVAIGMVLSFVPIKSGAKTFVSLSGAMNVSSDITGGIYGEYEIKTENYYIMKADGTCLTYTEWKETYNKE